MSEETEAALEGRVFVVTGAAGGIGRSCALTLARRGAVLIVTDLDPVALTEVATEVRALGGTAVAVRCDVTDRGSCDVAAERAVGEFGRLDGGVLAAGVAQHVRFLDLTPEQWRAVIDVHLTGSFSTLQALASRMRTGGSLVCVSSTVADHGGPTGQAHYVAAKAGASGLVRAAARELGPLGIRVNSVSPGFTDTGMNAGLFTDEERADRSGRCPMGRVAVPDDVARVVAFLLGADSGFVTGETIRVDGGAHLA